MNQIIWAIVAFVGYHGLNVFLGWWNVEIVMSRIVQGNKKQIEHGWWLFGYLVVCLPMEWAFNSWFALSVMLLHASIFPVSYNLFKGMPPFYLSKSTTSAFDRAMVKAGLKSSEVINLISEVVAIILFTISLFNLS